MLKNWSNEKLRAKLAELHQQESELSYAMSGIDKQVRDLKIKKRKLGKRMSANVLYRNKLIAFLK